MADHIVGIKGIHCEPSPEESYVGPSPDNSSILIQQNELLCNKIQLIEKQNLEQQRRLQQLEKLILEISSSKSPVEVLEQKPHPSFQNVVFREPIRTSEENLGFREPIRTSEENVRFREPIRTSDENLGFREPIRTSEENVGFREPIRTSEENVGFREPIRTLEENVGFQEPSRTSEENVRFQEPIRTSKENVGFQEPIRTSKENVGFQEPIRTSEENVGFREPIRTSEENDWFRDISTKNSNEINRVLVGKSRSLKFKTAKPLPNDYPGSGNEYLRSDTEYPQPRAAYPVNCRRMFEKLNSIPKRYESHPFDQVSQLEHGRKQFPISADRKLQMSDDVHSIMEEFDRTARENGLTYCMTPDGSVVSSEDLSDYLEASKETPMFPRNYNPVTEDTYLCDIDIMTSPTTEFLTPLFQRPAPTLSQYPGENGPMITPQSCLTTPVLLTSEALRAAERAHNHLVNPPEEYKRPSTYVLHNEEERGKSYRPYSDFKKKKVNPFSNLLNGIRQASKPTQHNYSPRDDRSGKESWLGSWHQNLSNARNTEQPFKSPANSCKSINSSHIKDWRQSMKLAYLSPMSDNHTDSQIYQFPFGSPNSHTSSRIRNWSRAMKLAHLSPMSESHSSNQSAQLPFCSPNSNVSSYIRAWNQSQNLACLSPRTESHCSDLDPHASEEEDLVVDEVVSLSVGRGSRPCSSTANTRQRSESVCSATGPCVPPDLLLDSGRHQVTAIENSEVEDENVLTEIAGILDGDFPLEDSVIIPDDGIISAPGVKVCGEDVIDVEVQDGGADLEEVVVEDEEEEEAVAYSGSQIEGNVKSREETKVVKSEDIQMGGGFRSVAELIGNKSQSLICKKIKSKQGPREQTLQVDEKDIQLQAGSIILAVVNESGSLVPLPQLQMKNTKLTNAIKVEASPEKATEEEIDVETVTEKAPVLEAGDVDSLLAQFEASEAVNTPSRDRSDGKSRNINSIQSISISNLKSVRQTCLPGATNTQASPQGSPTHQKIKDALPKEIIEKIKASTKRKSTQMLLEPLVVRKGRVVRQQETNQHRSKAHRAASTNASGQQAVNDRVPPPLDHDYCFSPDKQKKGKNSAENTSQAGDYLNKLPDYYTAKVSKGDNKKAINSTDDNHDDNGKKDSGVESGDVSDASVETEDRRKDARTIKSDRRRDNCDNGKNEDVTEKEIDEDIYDKLPPYMTDIGNSKPKDDDDAEDGGVKEECKVKEEDDEEEERQQQEEVKKIKRKLNLSEYRQRLQSAHSSRCPSPSQTDAMPKSPQESPVSLGELIQKMEDAGEKTKESTDSEVPERKSADSDPVVAVVEDVEEGELKGDSDHEMSKTTSDADSKLKTLSDVRIEKKALFTSPSSLNGSTSVCSREGRKSSSQGYASRRWSSSSHSRSRSRSPNVRRKPHSSSYSRSSRDKRRRAHRSSRSSVSPCRCWSRSRSRSCSRSRGGRSSSESSYCSTCSDSSKSRSRSRSHSSKKRERRSYSRRRYSGNWERRRRSRSWSRSSSRYSRGRRSRSPLWRDGRSRSPSRRSMRPRRREDENRVKQVEERRVIYVGRISEGTTKAELRHRFSKFGSIVDISVHFREHGDNYGFVTYKNKDEAYNAVEHGNEDPTYPRYDLCFGGRRAFCRVQYSDLDAQDEPPSYVSSSSVPGPKVAANTNVDFDSLLRAAMKRKTR